MGKPVSLTSSRKKSHARAAGIDHAAAGIEQRPLGGRHHLDRLLDLVGIALELRPIALVLEFLRLAVGALGELDVLRDIDHDRARPAAGGDMKRLVQRARQIGDGFHQIIVFGARPGDADGVAFLERVVADEMGRHLPGDDDERDGIAQRVGQAGDRVGRARPGGDQHAADLAGRARIALGGMHRALLVPHQDVAHLVLLEQRIIDRQHRAAGIAENVLDALIGKRRHHHFRAGHLCHCSLRSLPFRLTLSGLQRFQVIKKGPRRAPGFAHRHVSRVDYPPPAVRLDTRISELQQKSARMCPSFSVAIYKHCGSAGQAKCGGNRAPRSRQHFKRAFEIGHDAGKPQSLTYC